MTESLIARFLAGWQDSYDRDWPALFESSDDIIAAMPGNAHQFFDHTLPAAAILYGSAPGKELAPFVGALTRDVDLLCSKASHGSVTWSFMSIIDTVGDFAAIGAPGSETLWSRIRPLLSAIRTSRDIDVVHDHWHRGFAAIALAVPEVYRPLSGHEVGAPLWFDPDARPGTDLPALIGYFAAAVESNATLTICEPAWHELIAAFPELAQARTLGDTALVWLAIVLHHQIAKRPLATAADYLRDSIAKVAAIKSSGAQPAPTSTAPRSPDSVAAYLPDLRTIHATEWPRLPHLVSTIAAAPAGRAYLQLERPTTAEAIVGGSAGGSALAPFVDPLRRDLDYLMGETRGGQAPGSWMALVGLVGTFAAIGVSGAETLLSVTAACLPSLRTARSDEHVHHYWNRGFAALALGVPTIYRPISGADLKSTLPFSAGATFGMNLQALLHHLAAAVERGAPLSACEPAWRDVLAHFGLFASTSMLDASSLVWLAIILHHRIGKGSLATAADFVRDSVEDSGGSNLLVTPGRETRDLPPSLMTCPRCGHHEVRGGKQDLPSGDTLHHRSCASCGLYEDRLASAPDFAAWVTRWDPPTPQR